MFFTFKSLQWCLVEISYAFILSSRRLNVESSPFRDNNHAYDEHKLSSVSPGSKYSHNLFYLFLLLFLGVGWDWVHLVHLPLIGLLYQPRMIDDECGAVRGIRIGRGNRSIRRKPAPVPLCALEIPNDLTWARTRAATVGTRRLTAWAMARPCSHPLVQKLLISDTRPSSEATHSNKSLGSQLKGGSKNRQNARKRRNSSAKHLQKEKSQSLWGTQFPVKLEESVSLQPGSDWYFASPWDSSNIIKIATELEQ
jgi:hypothetical protein